MSGRRPHYRRYSPRRTVRGCRFPPEVGHGAGGVRTRAGPRIPIIDGIMPGYGRPSAPPNADDHSAGPGRSWLAPDGGRREAAFPLLGALRTIRMASKTSMEHRVVAERLDDSSWTTDCATLAKAADDMAAEGWTLVSLAVPNSSWALLAFARPKRDAE